MTKERKAPTVTVHLKAMEMAMTAMQLELQGQ
jgi:hypothetical protein